MKGMPATIARDDEFRPDEVLLRYSSFVPRLYNFCKSLGMQQGKIMPSRAFCSDESQGYPIILLAKHFGTFPFNHGRTGGVVSTDRHGPHAEHGQDLMILQASHVGYDPDTDRFGVYRRLQTEQGKESSACAKIDDIVRGYMAEYRFAQDNVLLDRCGGDCLLTIDNQLLDPERAEGLFLDLDFMLARHENGSFRLVKSHSTAQSFLASAGFKKLMLGRQWPAEGRNKIGAALLPELFRFKRTLAHGSEGQLERNLLPAMARIVSSSAPLLAAARANSRAEFDRAFRTFAADPGYHGKNLVYIAGINIDISPKPGQTFPLTLFAPWAAYVQRRNGEVYTLESEQLAEQLLAQSAGNPDEIDLDLAIQTMGEARELNIERTGSNTRTNDIV